MSEPPDQDPFRTTRWSVVLEARSGEESARRRSLEYLCQSYWFPLYAYVRRRGHPVEDAEDLTQAFFAQLIGTDMLASVEQSKGKFRAFLLVCLKNFLSNEGDKARAEKRGGRVHIVSFDAGLAEARYQQRAIESFAADETFDRDWALTLVDRAMESLRTEFRRKGQSSQWRHLRSTLSTTQDARAYEALAEALGTTPGAAKTAVHRLRKRYRDALRAQVADTVAPELVEEELRYLLKVLSG